MTRSLIPVALAILLGSPAAAQNLQCGLRDDVLAALAQQSQTRRAIGLAGRAVMEMFASDDTRRWTVTVTMPDGRMCLLANGIAFEEIEPMMPAMGMRL